jgi:DNA adenine methylase
MGFFAEGRPIARWHGGKWALGPKILPYFPKHRTYVEPFAGAASLFMQKERSFSECLNDLDGDIVNLFRVLRSPAMSAELERQLRLTPYAREEFDEAYKPGRGKVDRARRLLVRAYMGHGSSGAHHLATKTGFRSYRSRERTMPQHDWARYPDEIRKFCERLEGVIVENKPAAYVIQRFDNPDTLFYCDPPYVHSTRQEPHNLGKKGHYRHEMDDLDHMMLLTLLRSLKGMVVVSGYRNEIYDDRLGDWMRVDFDHFAGSSAGRVDRVESIWINPAAQQGQTQLMLMEVN